MNNSIKSMLKIGIVGLIVVMFASVLFIIWQYNKPLVETQEMRQQAEKERLRQEYELREDSIQYEIECEYRLKQMQIEKEYKGNYLVKMDKLLDARNEYESKMLEVSMGKWTSKRRTIKKNTP